MYRIFAESPKKTAFLRIASVDRGDAEGWCPAVFESRATANYYAKKESKRIGRRVIVVAQEDKRRRAV